MGEANLFEKVNEKTKQKKTMQQTKENNKHQRRGGESDNLTEKQKTVRQKSQKKLQRGF